MNEEKQPKIEKGIPIPDESKASVWREMEVGDSVGGLTMYQVAIARAWFHYNKRGITSRKQEDGTYRIWRTS